MPGDLVVTGTRRKEAKTYLRMIPDQPFGPPEICYSTEKTEIAGVYERDYGSGKSLYIPFRIAAFYYEFGYDNSYDFLKDIVCSLAGVKSIAPTLTPMCELAVTEGEAGKVIHLINLSGAFANYTYCEPLPIRDIFIEIACGADKNMDALNGGHVIRTDKGIKLDCLHGYEAIRIY